MPTTFRSYEPDQLMLLPPDMREWLPADDLAHHVSELVDRMDLTAFYAPYEGDGRRNAPYEPRMMLKVLIYAYATGVFSSRKIARKLETDVAFRILAAGNFPKHRTVCEFRRRHLTDFKTLFVSVVALAREMGLAGFAKLSIDGTKVRANASKRKAMSYGQMQQEERRLKDEIAALVGAADAADTSEDMHLGREVRGDEVPEELRRREEPVGGHGSGSGAVGGETAGGGRCPRPEAGSGSQSKGRPAVQAGVWRAGREGAEQLHGPGKRDHEDEQ